MTCTKLKIRKHDGDCNKNCAREEGRRVKSGRGINKGEDKEEKEEG